MIGFKIFSFRIKTCLSNPITSYNPRLDGLQRLHRGTFNGFNGLMERIFLFRKKSQEAKSDKYFD